MNDPSSDRAPAFLVNGSKHLAQILFLISIALAAYVAVWAWLNIRVDHPMEYRENAILFTADMVARGQNPYALKDRPVFANGFGIGYYWVAYPFVRLAGHSYGTLRAVSITFVVASCALLAWAVRMDKGSRVLAAAAALVLFTQLGQGLSIVARPDSVGLFFLLASLIVPYRCRFSPGSLTAGAALAILGCLTKPYFVLGMPLLFLYVFLFENKLRALIFGVGAVAALALTLFGINSVYECYLAETFFTAAKGATRSWEHLLRHGGGFVAGNLGFLYVLLAPLFLVKHTTTDPVPNPAGKIDFVKLHRPLWPMKMSFPGFILLGHAMALIFLLGLHTGNDILYYHQLASPFLLWVAFKLAEVKFQRSWPVMLALLLNVGWFAISAAPLPRDHSIAWRRVENVIATHTNVFTAPHLSHLLWRQGAPVYDTGHTEAMVSAMEENTSPAQQAYRQRVEAFRRDIRTKIRNREFDAVIVCRGWAPLLPMDELQPHYVPTGPLAAPMAFDYWLRRYPLEVWVPR